MTEKRMKGDRLSIGVLIGGVLVILTVSFLLYNVFPLLGGEHADIFGYSMASLVLGICAPLLFSLSDFIGTHDTLGKLSSGSVLAAFLIIGYHVSRTHALGKWGFPLSEVIVSGLLGLVTSLVFTHAFIVLRRSTETSRKQTIESSMKPGVVKSIEREISSLEEKEEMIDTRDIKKALKDKNIEKAKELLEKLEEDYQEYKQTIEKLESLDQRKSSLATQLADEKIDRKTFNEASESINTEKARLEEKLNKLRNEVIYEDYEKPF